MPALDKLPPARFDAISFPVTRRTAKLVTRYHVHEFPEMSGGAPEKLGRKVWEFTFEVPFHATNPRFPDLYAGSLQAITDRAERMDTAPLVIPEIGTIRAFIGELERTREGKSRSGETVTLRFVEDGLEPFRRAALSGTCSPRSSRRSRRFARRSITLTLAGETVLLGERVVLGVGEGPRTTR